MSEESETIVDPSVEGDVPATKPKAKAKAKAKAKPKAEKAPKDEKNGVVKPREGTTTRRVWDISTQLSEAAGSPAPRKDVLEACTAEDINPATTATQYGRWRRYHGIEGRPVKAKAEETETVAAGE